MPAGLAETARAALQEARESLAAGAYAAAREGAQNVIRHYAPAEGSGEALEILARASLALEDTTEAVEASAGYLDLLAPTHPAFPGAVILHSEALLFSGEDVQALRTLVRIPEVADTDALGRAVEVTRELASEMEPAALEDALDSLSPSHPIRGILETETAVALALQGDPVRAGDLARAALSRGLLPRERSLAEGVLAGNLDQVLGTPMILGAILPRTEVSPGLQEYAEAVLEGIQVAAEEFQASSRRPIRVEVRDDKGDPGEGLGSLRDLETSGAMGIIGPLTPDILREVAEARTRHTPVISPFASLPAEGAPAVLSLSGPDPGGARAVARYAWNLGLESVVILRPETEDAQVSGEAFRETFEGEGGYVPREIAFNPNETFFQTQFQEVSALLPDGLFLPLEPEDVQLLAPQFTFYGLDTLGIQLLGTDGWTDDQVVLDVDSRHTDGVVASTTRVSQGETEAFRRFREAYEALFQRTLRTDIPAFGYDAAALLLLALEEDPRSPEELAAAMEGIRDYPGATGRLSVEDGRILREPHLVRIQNHELIYISSRFE
jgi:ABC-type branched-subunit amino acid transport system substrate-binding protein